MGWLKLQVIGNLGQDCQVNNVNGKNVINMSVAYTEKWKDASGVDKSKTIWVSAAYWSDKTTVAQYLKKGQLVFLEGLPDVKTYKDGRGDTLAQLSLRVNTIQLLGGQKDNVNHIQDSSQHTHSNSNSSEVTEPVDALPF